jgi:secreted trypsin-like serine protease
MNKRSWDLPTIVGTLFLAAAHQGAASSTTGSADSAVHGSVRLREALRGAPATSFGLPKIIGGEPAEPGKDPWQVALIAANGVQFCSGSMITTEFVVTVAHCVDQSTKPEDVRVRAGTTDLRSGGSISSVVGIAVHELWNPTTHDFDIAILQVFPPPAGRAISVITPEQETSLLRDQMPLRTAGWGATVIGGPLQPLLYAVQVPFQPGDICNRPQSYGGRVTVNMVCAGYEVGRRDACQGDSGGPLTMSHESGHLLVGVVSWGDGCGRPYKFGVYTRMSRFIGWIQSKVARIR